MRLLRSWVVPADDGRAVAGGRGAVFFTYQLPVWLPMVSRAATSVTPLAASDDVSVVKVTEPISVAQVESLYAL